VRNLAPGDASSRGQREDVTVHDFTVSTADGAEHALADHAGRVLLIVNVASACGLTPQYAGLAKLHRNDHPRGLDVLGFPCNQFGGQEPGTDAEIQTFCSTTYDVTFPVFAKIDVNGPDADPLFRYLRTQAPGSGIGPEAGPLYEHLSRTRPEALHSDEVRWNFTKFLVGRDGEVLRRYEPTVLPEDIEPDVESLLG
jgi:glutathione peroxidase